MTYIPVLKLMKYQKLQSFYLFKHKHSIKYDEVAWQPKKWVSLELVHRKWSSRKWSLVLNDPHVLTFWSVLGAATVSSLLCPWWQGGGGRVCPFSFVSLPLKINKHFIFNISIKTSYVTRKKINWHKQMEFFSPVNFADRLLKSYKDIFKNLKY